jgi:hypothetical protein
MSKIAINKHHVGFEAVFCLPSRAGGNQIFHGIGKNKKEALKDLRGNIAKHLKALESTRTKLLYAIQEANGIIHTPALLNGEK